MSPLNSRSLLGTGELEPCMCVITADVCAATVLAPDHPVAAATQYARIQYLGKTIRDRPGLKYGYCEHERPF